MASSGACGLILGDAERRSRRIRAKKRHSSIFTYELFSAHRPRKAARQTAEATPSPRETKTPRARRGRQSSRLSSRKSSKRRNTLSKRRSAPRAAPPPKRSSNIHVQRPTPAKIRIRRPRRTPAKHRVIIPAVRPAPLLPGTRLALPARGLLATSNGSKVPHGMKLLVEALPEQARDGHNKQTRQGNQDSDNKPHVVVRDPITKTELVESPERHLSPFSTLSGVYNVELDRRFYSHSSTRSKDVNTSAPPESFQPSSGSQPPTSCEADTLQWVDGVWVF